MDARLLKSIETAADWRGETKDLEKNEIAIYQIKSL
jgi:hypothetical protein